MRKAEAAVALFFLSLSFCAAQEQPQRADSAPKEFSGTAQMAMASRDYVVTAGDVYQISYATSGGAVSYTVVIDLAYKLRVANLAILNVAGKTYSAVKRQVEEIISKNYPLSAPQFTMASPARFTVVITGFVTETTEREAWALTRLQDAIDGLALPRSSMRRVTITSAGGAKKVCDLFKASRDGDMSQNPYIRPGDKITVARAERKVSVTGAVEREGTYELLEGENLRAILVYYGGGLSPRADPSRMTLTRVVGGKNKSGDVIYFDGSDAQSDMALNDGDSIFVPAATDFMPSIVVEGIIKNPDRPIESQENADGQPLASLTYRMIIRFHEGENYSSVVRRIADFFRAESDLRNSYILREGEKLPIDIEKILGDAEFISPFFAEADDRLVIPFAQTLAKIIITGEVKATEEIEAWPLHRLSEIINGHLTEYSSTRGIEVASVDGAVKTFDLFKASRDGDMEQNPLVRSGETVTVKRAARKVSVAGAVEREGTYELLEGENLRALIERYGGGLVPNADTSRMTLTRMSGDERARSENFYLGQKDIDDDFPLLDDDQVLVSSLEDLQPVVFVEGAVYASAEGTVLETSERKAVRFVPGTNYAYFARERSAWFSAASDTENAYIMRKDQIIPINLNKMLYDASYYSEETLQPYDVLRVPFKQLFVSVAGSVHNPGRYPYIPDRDWEYYVGLAGGFVKKENSRDAILITDMNGKRRSKRDVITPETTITAKTNSFTYYFGLYAPIVTTALSVVTTAISIGVMATR